MAWSAIILQVQVLLKSMSSWSADLWLYQAYHVESCIVFVVSSIKHLNRWHGFEMKSDMPTWQVEMN